LLIRRAIGDFQDIQPEQLPFYSKLIMDILAEKILPDRVDVIREWSKTSVEVPVKETSS